MESPSFHRLCGDPKLSPALLVISRHRSLDKVFRPQDLPMRAFYLAAPEQVASPDLLNELGVEINKERAQALPTVEKLELTADHLGVALKETVAELKREYRWQAKGEEGLVVCDGTLVVDVRDSADEWIRITLNRGDAVVLPNTVYRRVVLGEDPCVVVERHASAAASGDRKLDLFVKDYRFTSSVDERMLQSLTADAQRDNPDMRQLIVELCAQFYELGWVQGTGGSISIRHGNRVYMTPSGVQKERILPEELYVLDMSGNKLFSPEVKPGRSNLKLTACAPLFFHSYRIRNAGAVIHSHGMECVLATLLCEGQTEFRMTHQEMIKGIQGHGYLSELVIPIIENTPHEEDLADSLGEAISKYPKATAVLVRRHGIYIWGPTWMAAKTQAECYHYLFKLALEMHRLGIDYTQVPGPSGVVAPAKVRGGLDDVMASQAGNGGGCCGGSAHGHPQANSTVTANGGGQGRGVKYVLLDIEGTTTSISFVHDVLFPFARNATERHIRERRGESELEDDIEALRQQAKADAASGSKDVPLIPAKGEASEKEITEAAIRNVFWQMDSDRKTTALKQLQGHIWRAGYADGLLKSHVYDDVPSAFERWTRKGLKLAIYSSGSREAQRLLFANTEVGDLRKHLCCFFDTTVGGKREAKSYAQIVLSLGVDHPSEILFLTDIIEEGTAARELGIRTVLSTRPGNAPLKAMSAAEDFPRVTSFEQVDKLIDGSATPN